MALNDDQQRLRDALIDLHQALRAETKDAFNRINPFTEDLFDWKERGEYWCGGDRNVTVYNSTTIVGEVDIGANSWIGPFCALDGTAGIYIGAFCSISSGCQVLTHDTVNWALSGGKAGYSYAPVRIGNCCFLGSKSIILKGTTIGDHCLIAAGSVVSGEIPSHSIVAGVPAKSIGTVDITQDGAVALRYGKQ